MVGSGAGMEKPAEQPATHSPAYVFYCLLLPWLMVFDIPDLHSGFATLISFMNGFHASLPF
ncbi:hypothetical protein KSD_70360 [Ktedonobacter sp. SOSP1-85]|nr:hypothetical protein KSD_70360 [Ktedonobacter sp. SOSP1-85]